MCGGPGRLAVMLLWSSLLLGGQCVPEVREVMGLPKVIQWGSAPWKFLEV